jgi:Rad3-related DNA helicase
MEEPSPQQKSEVPKKLKHLFPVDISLEDARAAIKDRPEFIEKQQGNRLVCTSTHSMMKRISSFLTTNTAIQGCVHLFK